MGQLYDNIEKRRAEMERWNESFKNDRLNAEANAPMMDGCIDGAAKSDYESDDEEMCDGGVGAVCYIKGGEECKMDAGKPSAGPGDSPPLKADPARSPKTSQPEPVVGVPVPPPAPVAKVLTHQRAADGGVKELTMKLDEAIVPVRKRPLTNNKKAVQESACCVVM